MQQNQGGEAMMAFRIAVGGTDLKFREVHIADPVPTGRQIIESAGGHPPDEYIVMEWPKDGDLLEIELDETTDLRKPGTERFIVAKIDRIFEFEIDGRRHGWPAPSITREALLAIAGQDPEQFSMWQELRNAPDKEVLTGHPADLTPEGTEKFYTVVTHTTEGRQ
jgi:hypothetical protein